MFLGTRLTSSVLRRASASSSFSSSSKCASQLKNRVDLDPSLAQLMRDVDMSLGQKKRARTAAAPTTRELEEVENIELLDAVTGPPADLLDFEPFEDDAKLARKSPAAAFGSENIGMVVLPLELTNTINALIAETDKRQLHNDAQRLFNQGDNSDGDDHWNAEHDTRYRTKAQAREHSERDGSAFASVALPAHFSAITAVLDHVKKRLEPEWRVERILDWGSGAGSALWGSAYSFQEPNAGGITEVTDRTLSNTSLRQYIGIDKREGLVTVSRRLLKNVDTGAMRVSWRKSLADHDTVPRSEGHYTVAISAFMLTSLTTHVARKQMIKEMWASGAHVMIVIDHSTKGGFESVAAAREFFLSAGRKEMKDPEASEWEEDVRGSHVVAPCPHDGACPLYYPGDIKLVCGFSQRLQRPEFVRKTKHSGQGHEDMPYSYVVIRRGTRPPKPETSVGRIGTVGKASIERELAREPVKEIFLDSEHDTMQPLFEAAEENETEIEQPINRQAMNAALRAEAFHWPRLVFPPLKKSGHIILDGCTPEGKIMRMTIPKSQGKQPFYDARKSGWGDIFPHPPKNPPQIRVQFERVKGKEVPVKHSDIGKRGNKNQATDADYGKIAIDLKAERKAEKRRRMDLKRQYQSPGISDDNGSA
ncbi:unnamed protein product [Mycena citricolor]|uniref:Rsm22-domain-containing protein n=1 Tax=Mycena citricolor TaxID=2018698 RepID=A0AAD2Q6T9_9AGAR|nr:unnamed protein product [Mycena citricolor]